MAKSKIVETVANLPARVLGTEGLEAKRHRLVGKLNAARERLASAEADRGPLAVATLADDDATAGRRLKLLDGRIVEARQDVAALEAGIAELDRQMAAAEAEQSEATNAARRAELARLARARTKAAEDATAALATLREALDRAADADAAMFEIIRHRPPLSADIAGRRVSLAAWLLGALRRHHEAPFGLPQGATDGLGRPVDAPLEARVADVDTILNWDDRNPLRAAVS